MLSAHEIDLIRSSWTTVALAPEAGTTFYKRLFQVAPQVQPLFKNSVQAQSRKLMETLAVVVDLLDDLNGLLPIARSLALRHLDYGVTASQYPIVGDVLIWTLKSHGGDRMTPECVAAWTKAYGLVQSAMIEAAYGPGKR